MVASALRMYVFYQHMVDSFDITWNATITAIWGVLETSLAGIIASLPALNQVFKRFYKRYVGSEASENLGMRGENNNSRSLFERFHVSNMFKSVGTLRTTTQSGRGTFVSPEYLELGDAKSDQSRVIPKPYEEHQETNNYSYPDITADRNFYFSEDQISSDLELGDMVHTDFSTVSKPPAVHLSRRRPSSPTISGAVALQNRLNGVVR
ncbi:hypothetical protein ABW20_dc0110085 [Dactylellina cionopaga]|nr:hypothetical protein ABW20_dc0110085 [Dactylellina cionopaga]